MECIGAMSAGRNSVISADLRDAKEETTIAKHA